MALDPKEFDMAKSRDDAVTASPLSEQIAALDGHQKRLTGLLAKETDSVKRNAIVQQRSAIKLAMSQLANATR